MRYANMTCPVCDTEAGKYVGIAVERDIEGDGVWATPIWRITDTEIQNDACECELTEAQREELIQDAGEKLADQPADADWD